MKKSLIALVIGVAALGFAQNAQATYTVEVTGTLSGSAATDDVNGLLRVKGEGNIGAAAVNFGATDTDEVVAGEALNTYGKAIIEDRENFLDIDVFGYGAGTIGAAGALSGFGKSSDTNMTVASSSSVNLTAINGSDGSDSAFKVELNRLEARGGLETLPAFGVLTGTVGEAYSNAVIFSMD